MIPGKMAVDLPTQSVDLESQLQEVVDLASNKALKIADKNTSIGNVSGWISFTETLKNAPVFLLARDGGEVQDRYEYTVSLAPTYSSFFPDVTLNNCQLSIHKRDINDFILDCRSSDTRILWSSGSAKISDLPEFKNTYHIVLTKESKQTWKAETRENAKVT